MVPIQATIYPITPIDAEVGGIIKFSWQGNQAFKNRCIIKEHDTGTIIYDKTIETFKYEHVIDLTIATLINGTKYSAYITVFDIDDTESDIQPLGEPFLCLKTPIFSFANIAEGSVISSSAYTFSLMYEQEDGELLDSWAITLYSTSHTSLSSSGTIYDTSDLSHTFSGFSNRNQYSLRAIGKTVNGIELDTGYVTITVTYSVKDVFSLLDPINVVEQGAIHLLSNIVSSEGHLLKDPVYIDGDFIDLRDNELSYTEGYEFRDDFSFVNVFYGAQPNQEILTMSSATEGELELSVKYRVGKFGSDVMMAQYELTVTNGLGSRVYYSESIDIPEDTDLIGLLIVRQNGFYVIEAINLTKAGIR